MIYAAAAIARTVVPTYVGVILKADSVLRRLKSGPHVCGGDPKNISMDTGHLPWSPRMWG